ncbi:glycosyltransferase [Sphingobacterium sp. DK4209]|uniref:Glycosyltransferase n=1 Tax=Sphingobacterium zhuxiongii TaxID=2662364 RepID=A0A5Q0QIB8_9SPHI|nr:glycosyltransferase [Sphingobacterium sp. DK4209]QGA27958.1 glycosyltransferase [Sphingobacterium sp. dk4302]
MTENKIKIYRVSTVSHSLSILLKKQFSYLGTKGYSYTLLCSPDERILRTAVEEKAKFLPLYITRSISPFRDLFELFRLIKYLRRDRPDIIHSHSPKGGLIAMIGGFLVGTKLRVHTVAGLPLVEATGSYRFLLICLEKLIYSCANFVIFNSPMQAAMAIQNGWIRNDKVKVIGKGSSNGIDLKYFRRSPQIGLEVNEIKTGLRLNNAFVISFVGRIAKSKGIEELVEAFQILQIKHSNLALVLVGMRDDADPISSDCWHKIIGDQSIRWIDHKDDVRPYFQMSDAFVFPSYREGFPQVLMQACAMQCSIISTNINGANEIIDDGVTGLLINTKSVEEIVSSTEKLITDQPLRESLAQNSRKVIEDGYDQLLFWDSLDKLYSNNLKGND